MPDRRVLITAGASGIGRAMAQLFSDAGWNVWVTDVDPDALARCHAEWRMDCVDVSDVSAMADLFARVSRDWGGLETLCANAGIAGKTALIEVQDIPTFRQCLEVNLDRICSYCTRRTADHEGCREGMHPIHRIDIWQFRHTVARALCRVEMC